MEENVCKPIEELWNKKQRVIRIVVFLCVKKNYPTFKCGPSLSANYFATIKIWFQKGFNKSFKLSCTRIAGASRKFPADWRIKVASMIRRVASSQVCKRCRNNLVPPIVDRNVTNTYNVPFCRDMV